MAGVDSAALVGRPEEGLRLDQYSFVFLKITCLLESIKKLAIVVNTLKTYLVIKDR